MKAGRSSGRQNHQWESYRISESTLERLDDGEAITGRLDVWLRVQLAQLEAVREDVNRARKEESWLARLPENLSALSDVV